jgi:hypothetical protein
MGDERKEKISAALMRASLVLMILGLIALVAALSSPSRRSPLMSAAQALSLGGLVSFLGAWRLLLGPTDENDDPGRQWWWTTVAFLALLAVAYWAWVGEFW